MIHPSHGSPQLCSRGYAARQWFMRVCNWVLIKSVSGAHVIVCFQDPPCVSLCVIGCYRCCECMSGLKERMDRLQCDCSLKNAFKSTHIFLLCFKGWNYFFYDFEFFLIYSSSDLWTASFTAFILFIFCNYSIRKNKTKWIS